MSAETQSAPSLRELSEAPVAILYRNWRGEVTVRQIVPGAAARAFWFGSTEWHPEPQWLMTATDVEKNASRDFALSGILAWGRDAILARVDRINGERLAGRDEGRLIDPTTQSEAVASARAEGVREGLERAAEEVRYLAGGLRTAAIPCVTNTTLANYSESLELIIRALAQPTAPGGRTDG